MINPAEELEVYRGEVSDRAAWDSWWQNIRTVVDPSNAYVTQKHTGVPSAEYHRIYDTTVIESAEGLRNMMDGRLTPAGEQWMVFLPPFEFRGDEEVLNWYAECSQRVMHMLHQSNFGVINSILNWDRATVGTGSMLCYETGNKYMPFRFHHIPIGQYVFSEDLDGHATEFKEEFEATAMQLKRKFPEGSFGPKITAAMSDPKKRHRDKFTVVHIVKEREDADSSKSDNMNFPYAEAYLSSDDENTIFETGLHEFNGMVSRFQMGADGSKWGVSPVRKAMPAVAQANFLQEQLDILLDLQINPRILMEAGAVGEVNMNPGQKTLMRGGAMAGGKPPVQEWLTGGQYPLGKDRISDKQEQIRKLFYHGMWADLARVDKEMTAAEVNAIRDQSEVLFVGANARFEADMIPLLAKRVFSICLRTPGILPPMPPQLANETNGLTEVPDPEVSFQTSLSRVLRRKAVEEKDMFFMRLERAAQLDPDVLDPFDLQVMLKEVARGFGMKSPEIRTAEEVAQITVMKLQKQQEMEQMQNATAAIDAGSKLPEDIQRNMIGAA